MRRVLLSKRDGRAGWRDWTSVCGILSLAAFAAASFTPGTAAAQGNRTKVTYTVEFRTTGALLDANCAATGTDVLTGTMVGFEPPLPDEDNEYVGNGFADVMFTLHEGQRGGYLQYIPNRAAWSALLPPRPSGPTNSVVTGTCDPAELAQLQSDYDGGQTAGSPSGQPLEVPGFPPLRPRPSFPLVFPPTPPNSIWTLTVLDRQP